MIPSDESNPLNPEIPEGPIPEELVDRFFDRELDGEDRTGFIRRLDADPKACEHVAKTNRFLTLLRRGVRTPDLSESILERVDSVRGFVPPAERRLIRFGRLAVAAMLFGVIAGAVVVQRRAPQVVELAGPPTPVRDIARAAQRDADGLARLTAPVRIVNREVLADLAAERAMWGPRTLDAESQSVVSWSLPHGASRDEDDTVPRHALLLVGGRIVHIGDTSDFEPPRATLAPVTFRARVQLPSVRSSTLRDLP
ncbi:MAG: hypothetical protein KF912_03885 [Phycisphaeraceae bacterium]|nr:hypothetical protein [Phycisphaeraceae bacterium]